MSITIAPQATVAPQATITPQAGSPARKSRVAGRAFGVIAGAVLGLGLLGGASPASAQVAVSGVTFTIDSAICSTAADNLEVMVHSNARSGSFAMIYLYNVATGTWAHESEWHEVDGGFGLLLHDNFSFRGHGYYRVYLQYAQSTTAGWVYTGEYVQRFAQRNANGYGTYASTTCYI